MIAPRQMQALEDALARLDAAFADTALPGRWDRGTCQCAECTEHIQTLENYRSGELPLHVFGNAAWDPVTVANDDAFLYFLPRLVHLAALHPQYLEQLLFHITIPDRLHAVTDTQADALRGVVSALMEVHPALLEPPLLYRTDELLRLLDASAR